MGASSGILTTFILDDIWCPVEVVEALVAVTDPGFTNKQASMYKLSLQCTGSMVPPVSYITVHIMSLITASQFTHPWTAQRL